MKTEFTTQDELDLLEQINIIKTLPAGGAGSRFISNSWLIDGEVPRTVHFTFQTLLPAESPNGYYHEPIVVEANKELLEALRENFYQIAEILSKEFADKLWATVYNDDLKYFWANANGGGMSICNGQEALGVFLKLHNPELVPGDTCPVNASETALLETMARCRAIVAADHGGINFSMTVPDPNGTEISLRFDFISYKNEKETADLPPTVEEPFKESKPFTRLANELGFLSPHTFSELVAEYMCPLGGGEGSVAAAQGDNFVLLRREMAGLKVTFGPVEETPKRLN